MIFPNMKESGLYGRSLFAHLQKENDQTPVLVWSLSGRYRSLVLF